MVNRAEEIYPIVKTLKRELEYVRKDKHNAGPLEKYYHTRVAEGISKPRLHKCINTLRQISKRLQKPFAECTKEDFVKMISELEESNLSDWTKRDYKVILKQFYRWFRNWDEGCPPEVRWIKKTRGAVNKNPVLPKDLLTKEEKLALLRATQNPRDRAMLEVFFESGRRMEEILTLHIGDVQFDDVGAKLFINGKMGDDFARIISSSTALAVWLDMHPLRDDPDAPVWIGLRGRTKHKQIAYATARLMLKRIAERAKIKKRVFFYLFRHTRIDETQGLLTEPMQCMMFGWKFGSAMPATYMKRYGKHIDSAQMIMNGKKTEEKKDTSALTTKECTKCGLENSPVSKFCNKCGGHLDLKDVMALDSRKGSLDKLLYGVASDPEKFSELRDALTKICKKERDVIGKSRP